MVCKKELDCRDCAIWHIIGNYSVCKLFKRYPYSYKFYLTDDVTYNKSRIETDIHEILIIGVDGRYK